MSTGECPNGTTEGERPNGTSASRLIAQATARLAEAGLPSPRPDAQLLAAFALGVPRGQLPRVSEFRAEQATRYHELIAARCARVPLQHLTGVAPFRYLEIAVGPGVFVPRPETELLVTWVLDHGGLPDEPVVVDLCSGSGALALSFGYELAAARVYAVERDPAALTWLRGNAAARQAAGDEPVTVIAGDATATGTLRELDGAVDAIVCNPPYVPAGTPVPAEVAQYDPPVAVFADGEGLGVLAAVIDRAAVLLRPGGVLALEHDDTQAEAVLRLLRATGVFTEVEAHCDLAQRPRFATARRAGRLAYCDAL